MRMWGIDPKKLCRKHLLGEHVEMHMFVGTIKRGKSIEGYIKTGLVNPALINFRHDQLVAEMEARGYNHNSFLEPVDLPYRGIDIKRNELELRDRCKDCRELQEIKNC